MWLLKIKAQIKALLLNCSKEQGNIPATKKFYSELA